MCSYIMYMVSKNQQVMIYGKCFMLVYLPSLPYEAAAKP